MDWLVGKSNDMAAIFVYPVLSELIWLGVSR